MVKKVLTVDDSDLVQNIYTFFFSKFPGCQIVKASNGVEALDKLATEEAIELIILDINMPLMDGLTLLRTIQRDGLYTNIPVIVVSTEGSEEDTVRALQLGAKGYIKKPVKAPELKSSSSRLWKSTAPG